MPTFSDDFERADGAPGGNWVAGGGSPTIQSGRLGATSTWSTSNSTVTDASYLKSTAHVLYVAAGSSYSGPTVKHNAAAGTFYFAYVYPISGTPNFRLAIDRGAGLVDLATTPIVGSLPTYIQLSIEWNEGALTATCTGGYELTASNTELAAAQQGGLRGYGRSGACDDIFITGTDVATLSVDPEVIGNYGECTEVTLTGTGTSWTAGTPGSPTFTVDHGTISAQEVTSETTATLTYCPGDYLGAIIFTDPSTGETAGALVTSDPGTLPPEPPDCLTLTDEAKDLIENAVAGSPDPHFWASHNYIGLAPIDITTTELFVRLAQFLDLGTEPTITVGEAIENLRKGTLGAWEADDAIYVPNHEQAIKVDTDQILSFLEATPNDYASLADIVALLGGSPTVLSHQDLKTAIDNVASGIDLSSVLDKLDSIQGSSLISITDLAGLLNSIQTIAGYSLGDVLAAIGALNPATAPGLAASTATIMGSLGALALEIAAIGAAETEDAAASSAGALSAAGALAWLLANGPVILDMLHDLQELLAASGNAAPHPPVWPGLANVDLGAAVDLATTNTLAGPMHGVLLDITSADPGTNRYLYDTVPAWKNIGALSFFTDTGHHETYQALSFAQALYVPKTMAVAGGVRVFHGRGPEGTIRPWSYKT